jgi:hypothetical protein
MIPRNTRSGKARQAEAGSEKIFSKHTADQACSDTSHIMSSTSTHVGAAARNVDSVEVMKVYLESGGWKSKVCVTRQVPTGVVRSNLVRSRGNLHLFPSPLATQHSFPARPCCHAAVPHFSTFTSFPSSGAFRWRNTRLLARWLCVVRQPTQSAAIREAVFSFGPPV